MEGQLYPVMRTDPTVIVRVDVQVLRARKEEAREPVRDLWCVGKQLQGGRDIYSSQATVQQT